MPDNLALGREQRDAFQTELELKYERALQHHKEKHAKEVNKAKEALETELHKLKEENIQLAHEKKTQGADVKRLEEEFTEKLALQKKLELADLEIRQLTKANELFEKTCDE